MTVSLASPALAGMAPDPRPGDTLLGKEGGLAYVSDPETATDPGLTQAYAACPDAGGPWRLTGGGLVTSGSDPESGFEIKASRPLDMLDLYGDDDSELDDYWDASVKVPVDSTVEAFAICAKWDRLKQKHVDVPDSPTGNRTATNQCARGKVSGGGGFIATTGSYISSMYPKGDNRWRLSLVDAIGGIGGMGNYLICARGQDLRVRVDSVQVPVGESRAAFVRCESGEHVTGGGGRSAGAPGAMNLYTSYPLDLGDSDEAPDDAWQANAYNRSASPKKLKAYAICAD